jgi:hypothetical protein
VRDAANQAEVITLPELYSSHYLSGEDVDNFAGKPLYSTSFIAFSALAKN